MHKYSRKPPKSALAFAALAMILRAAVVKIHNNVSGYLCFLCVHTK